MFTEPCVTKAQLHLGAKKGPEVSPESKSVYNLGLMGLFHCWALLTRAWDLLQLSELKPGGDSRQAGWPSRSWFIQWLKEGWSKLSVFKLWSWEPWS